jgi:hypothetical protein
LEKRKGIVVFGFGSPPTIRANRRLVEIASLEAFWCDEEKISVYSHRDFCFDGEIGMEVDYLEEEPGNPPTTLRIARGAIGWAIQKNIGEIIIVAAKPHLWRAMRDLQFAIREAKAEIEVCASGGIDEFEEDDWFFSDSEMLRTSSKKAWNRRERILKQMPMFIYRYIAG